MIVDDWFSVFINIWSLRIFKTIFLPQFAFEFSRLHVTFLLKDRHKSILLDLLYTICHDIFVLGMSPFGRKDFNPLPLPQTDP